MSRSRFAPPETQMTPQKLLLRCRAASTEVVTMITSIKMGLGWSFSVAFSHPSAHHRIATIRVRRSTQRTQPEHPLLLRRNVPDSTFFLWSL
jgi:hypothetical protein